MYNMKKNSSVVKIYFCFLFLLFFKPVYCQQLLTVIRQPAFDIGQNATELLIQIIESKRPFTEFETRVLETELIIRKSSLKKPDKISSYIKNLVINK